METFSDLTEETLTFEALEEKYPALVKAVFEDPRYQTKNGLYKLGTLASHIMKPNDNPHRIRYKPDVTTDLFKAWNNTQENPVEIRQGKHVQLTKDQMTNFVWHLIKNPREDFILSLESFD